MSLIPEELLRSSKKILFVTHLAIGDFTYLQSFFKLFKKHYPHLEVDIWIDEVRRTRIPFMSKGLGKYVLFDWVKSCDFFKRVYTGTHTWKKFNERLCEARQEDYPIVISLCSLRSDFYAKMCRKISPTGFVAGLLEKKHIKRGVNKIMNEYIRHLFHEGEKVRHITDVYQRWFEQLFGFSVEPSEKAPFIDVPRERVSYGKLKFTQWGIGSRKERFEKVIFLNPFAKNVKRSWPIDRTLRLITSLQEDEKFSEAYFVLSVEPRYYDAIRAFLSNFCLSRVMLFTADQNFFQLPSVISLCDLVISVETSVIHLASALNVPVVALMRCKSPEWGPFYEETSSVIMPKKRSDWVEDIPLSDVIEGVKSFQKGF